MMKSAFGLIFFIMLLAGNSIGQVTSSLLLSKDTILIGDALDITLKLKVPSRYTDLSLDFSPFDTMVNMALPDTMDYPPVDITWEGQSWDSGPKRFALTLDPSEAGKTARTWSGTFPIRVWDLGIYTLPHPRILTNTGDTIQGVYQLQSPQLMVLIPQGMAPIDTTQAIIDIKSIVTEATNWRDYIWAILLFIGLIALGLTIWYGRKLRLKTPKVVMVEPEVIIPAHEKALAALEELRAKAMWETGDIKKYQEQLTYIIRDYLENRYDILALESTTSEIMQYLTKVDFDTSYESKLKEILQIADLVKYAKANPPDDIHERFLNSAEEFVVNTKLENQERDELDT